MSKKVSLFVAAIEVAVDALYVIETSNVKAGLKVAGVVESTSTAKVPDAVKKAEKSCGEVSVSAYHWAVPYSLT